MTAPPAAAPSPARARLAALIATCGGIGNLPKAPGTWGSLAALPLAWGLLVLGGPPALAAAALVLFLAGCWAAEVNGRATGVHDPGSVVVDEVVGQWLTLLAAPSLALGWRGLALGFLLFRLFDIWKPWPVRLADRRLKGGFGVMADDILAAVYGGLLLAVLAPFVERL